MTYIAKRYSNDDLLGKNLKVGKQQKQEVILVNNDCNEKRVFECGCTVQWHLDKIKFTDCAAHSDKGVEVRAVDKVTITV